MNAIRVSWFIVIAIFYPLRLIIFWLHSIFVFLSKPGAKIILPVLLLGGGLILRTGVEAAFGGPMSGISNIMIDLVGLTTAVEYRVEIFFVILFAGMYFTLLIVGRILTPVVGALPAPVRPMPPLRPLLDREHSVATVRVRQAIKRTKRGRYDGNLEMLSQRLPKDVQALLSPPGRRAPINVRSTIVPKHQVKE